MGMIRGVERFGSNVFWSAVWIAIVLFVLYLVTGFVKRHFAGTLFGNAAQAIENGTQPS